MHELVLVRHGETEWSRSGQHTGVTDLPLTEEGRRQSEALGTALAEESFALVVTSPRLRATQTAELAQLARLADVTVDEDLVEWDYGGYEGRTTAEISAELGRPWTVFADGVVPGDTPGETLDQVADRADAVLRRIRPVLEEGPVALVGHGHTLRVLTARFLGLEPDRGAMFRLQAGTISRLGHQHDVPAILLWNAYPS